MDNDFAEELIKLMTRIANALEQSNKRPMPYEHDGNTYFIAWNPYKNAWQMLTPSQEKDLMVDWAAAYGKNDTWVSIDSTMPSDSRKVLVKYADGLIGTGEWHSYGKGWLNTFDLNGQKTHGSAHSGLTHWSPLETLSNHIQADVANVIGKLSEED